MLSLEQAWFGRLVGSQLWMGVGWAVIGATRRGGGRVLQTRIDNSKFRAGVEAGLARLRSLHEKARASRIECVECGWSGAA